MNTKEVQTIDLAPLYKALKECGFEDKLSECREPEFAYHEMKMYHGTVKASLAIRHNGMVILEVEIGEKIKGASLIQDSVIASITRRDLVRMITKTANQVIDATRNAINGELEHRLSIQSLRKTDSTNWKGR
ncbi:MAG: hypothetical protein BGO30_08535 [Bacteroidetes bacterium 41-46]|nr:MAG: hypothetical protein BGO30_08535 [Bacteroidetes bacterium 41-46]